MELKFEVYTKIKKPIEETFDAVYDSKKLSKYFTTGGALGSLDEGNTVIWDFHDFPGAFPVVVKKTIKNELIIFDWNSSAGDYKITVIFKFLAIDKNSSMVRISESGWPLINQQSIDEMNSHSSGWMQMLCCLKVYLEDGKNLREFFF